MIKIGRERRSELRDDDKIRWNPYYRIVKLTPDEIYITHGLRSVYSFSIVDNKELHVIGKMTDMLQSSVSLKDLVNNLNLSSKHIPYINETIESFYKKGIIVRENECFLPYYQVHYKTLPTLSNANIGLIGAGFIGMRVVQNILSMQVGKSIMIADDRKISNKEIESKNFLFFLMDGACGDRSNYIHILAKYLQRFETLGDKVEIQYFNVLDEQTLKNILRSSDITIIGMERYHPRLFSEINLLAHEEKASILYSFVDGSLGIVGPLVIPGETACYTCMEASLESSMTNPFAFTTFKTFMEKQEEYGENQSLSGIPPLYDIVSGFVVDSFIRFFLSGDSVPIINRALIIDFESLEMDLQDILKIPGCPACSTFGIPQMSPTAL
ncbi:MAG: hypothetical protein AB1410_08735 [Acidobacteriota bacterium]